MDDQMKDLQKQINNHHVLHSELTQLKTNGKLYRKQENSDIFFISSVEKEMSNCKDTLDDLVKEYSKLEKATPGKTEFGQKK